MALRMRGEGMRSDEFLSVGAPIGGWEGWTKPQPQGHDLNRVSVPSEQHTPQQPLWRECDALSGDRTLSALSATLGVETGSDSQTDDEAWHPARA